MIVGSAWAADATEVQRAARLEPSARSACRSSMCVGEPLWECVKSALLAMQGSSLVIFDWDDTLLPTTDLALKGCLKIPKASLCSSGDREHSLRDLVQSEQLAACSRAAVQALQCARHLGNRLIVTNSDHGWVHDTAAKFLPSLAAELKDIPVISARSIFEPQGISDAKQWKILCFRRIVQCFHSGPAGIFGVRSLVSIGDSLDEQEATMKVSQCCPCYVKSLKLMERPSTKELLQQLELCSHHLAAVAYHVGNLDIDVGRMLEEEGPSVKIDNENEPMQKKRRLLPWADKLGA